MEMKVSTKYIKAQRQSRLWSQEQLAELSGISIRTIQRIESSGNASQESIKALCSVFECDTKDLLLGKEVAAFTEYKHTQIAWFIHIVLVLVTVFIWSAFSSHKSGISISQYNTEFWVLTVNAIVFVVLAVLFFSLSIKVNKQEISWYFGPKFWRRSVKLSEVKECYVVRNSVLNGFGIRALGEGWLYNVSGLLAVEVRLKGGSVVRLGSDEPNYLKQAIEIAIEQNKRS
jgi:transcriptional regulator with XRE-family HTH domain